MVVAGSWRQAIGGGGLIVTDAKISQNYDLREKVLKRTRTVGEMSGEMSTLAIGGRQK